MGASAAHSFAATQWSLVMSARQGEGADSRAALEALAERYWYPLYAYIRRKGHTAADAEDLTQEFFRLFVEKGFLTQIDPAKGRFRAFLLACVNHLLAHQRERASAQKRGGNRKMVTLEAAESRYAMEARTETPERLFERRWALQMLETVMQRLQEHYADEKELFASLRCVLTMPGDASYRELAARLSMSEGALRTAAHRMRRRYRDLLREEIAQTVGSASEVADEIRYLMNCL
jgi:RNA polymerase sigma factor (sigma-70 family)